MMMMVMMIMSHGDDDVRARRLLGSLQLNAFNIQTRLVWGPPGDSGVGGVIEVMPLGVHRVEGNR